MGVRGCTCGLTAFDQPRRTRSSRAMPCTSPMMTARGSTHGTVDSPDGRWMPNAAAAAMATKKSTPASGKRLGGLGLALARVLVSSEAGGGVSIGKSATPVTNY